MSEDSAESVRWHAIEESIRVLREEGHERSAKLEAILLQATKTNGRVNGLEARERERDAKLDKVEKRVWQVATAICILMPGASKLLGIFTQ